MNVAELLQEGLTSLFLAVLFRSLSTDFVARKFVAGKVWFGGLYCDREEP